MAGHNFKALQTFRGFDSDSKKLVYGWLEPNASPSMPAIHVNSLYSILVPKKSIGIYTGRDDKNGTPIFAGLPEDGNIGSDEIKCMHYNGISNSPYTGKVKFHKHTNSFYLDLKFTEDTEGPAIMMNTAQYLEVIGTAYEQHLKDTKC